MNIMSPGLLGSPGIPWDLLGSPDWPEKRDFFPQFSQIPAFRGTWEKLVMMKPWGFTLSREGRAGFFPTMNFAWIASFPAPPTPVFPSMERMHRSNKEPLHTGATANQGWDIPPSTRRKVIPKQHFRSLGSGASWDLPNPGFSASIALSAAGNWGREEQAAPGAAHPSCCTSQGLWHFSPPSHGFFPTFPTFKYPFPPHFVTTFYPGFFKSLEGREAKQPQPPRISGSCSLWGFWLTLNPQLPSCAYPFGSICSLGGI